MVVMMHGGNDKGKRSQPHPQHKEKPWERGGVIMVKETTKL